MDYIFSILRDNHHYISWDKIIYFYLPTLATAYIIYKLYKLLLWPLISPLSKIPSAPYNPLLGNTLDLMKSETMDFAIRLSKKLGPVTRYFFFLGTEVVSITGPDEMKHVLINSSKYYDRSADIRKTFTQLMGNGLLSSSGNEHTSQRKLINPAFNHTSIKGMLGYFQKYSKELRHYWQDYINKNRTEDVGEVVCGVQVDLGRATLDVIGETAFGYKFNAILEPNKEITKTFSAILQGALTGSSWKRLIPFYQHLPTKENQAIKKAIGLVKKTVLEVIEHRRNEIKDGKKQPKDLLYLLMMAKDEETGQGLSDQELQDHVITFMFAGQETTSTGISWTLYCLASHPKIQDKVREEIRDVLPDDELITWEHLERLQYLKAVINESVRLFPPVPMIPKVALQDDRIGQYYIPAGTFLLLHIGAMQRNPDIWPDPESFNPERFTDPDNLPKPYTFLPFSLGRRNCIGNKFAQIAMRVILAGLLRDLKFSPVENYEFRRTLRITMRPKPPMLLKISKVG